MKRVSLLFVLCLLALQQAPTATGPGTRLLRMPTVSATQIAFAYAGNIWTVERAGGMARPSSRSCGPEASRL